MWSVCDCILILHFSITEEDTRAVSLARAPALYRGPFHLLSEVMASSSVSRHADADRVGRVDNLQLLSQCVIGS